MRIALTLYRAIFLVLFMGVTFHTFLLSRNLWWNGSHEGALSLFNVLDFNRKVAKVPQVSLTSVTSRKINSKDIQLSWKSHLNKSCETLGLKGDLASLDRETLYQSKILVDDKHKLLYCQIAKVASTTWRRVFLTISEKINITDSLAISSNDVHHKYDKYLTHLNDLPKDKIAEKLKTYFKFVFVREPFGRIVSAFRNKFVVQTNSSQYFQKIFGKKIIKRYRLIPPVVNTGKGVKFEEFAKYLTDKKRKIPMNEHWEKFHNLCHPCHIYYDFVGKLETFTEDSQYILTLKSLSERVRIPTKTEARYTTYDSNSVLKEYYSSLSKSTLKHLYKTYKEDFAIFNYTIPDIVKDLMV